ncbi:hypothetical protein [Geomicrobium sediminis]|uniref:Uncharacterized protein n=1 Tax=Geomicrobium sediminis TaxID=1347788 RepID=A0ABS2PFM5_9BACL|nr:hypothetical protein [Geomicrobium sediminis]MBM7634234.1 hypothetical protein [Geomicrobium sediminis]
MELKDQSNFLLIIVFVIYSLFSSGYSRDDEDTENSDIVFLV